MQTFTIETTEIKFPIKIDGQEFIVDFSAMHPTWVTAHLRKAAQRYLNDKHAGVDGPTKRDLVAADLKDMALGNPMPQKERKAPQAAKADPVRKMARDLATTFLTTRFRAAFKTDDMSVWAKNDKAAKYLRFTEKGSARFDLAKVDEWIDSFAEQDGGQDFMEQARSALADSEAAEDVDLEALGL